MFRCIIPALIFSVLVGCSETGIKNGSGQVRQDGPPPEDDIPSITFDIANIDISTLRLCTEDLLLCTEAPRTYSIADRGDPLSDLGAAQCYLLEVDEGMTFKLPAELRD